MERAEQLLYLLSKMFKGNLLRRIEERLRLICLEQKDDEIVIKLL